MTSKHHFALVLLVLLCFSAYPASAQVQLGTPAFGSYAGGPDTVNLGNNNVRWLVPVVHKAGRGTPFSFDLVYNTSVWYPVTSGSTTTWTPNQFGWVASTPSGGGYVTYKTLNRTCRFFMETQWVTEPYTEYYYWTYVDAFGTAHLFNGATYNPAPDCGPQTTTATMGTNDGSGLQLSADEDVATSLKSSKGASISFGSRAYTDRNGNQITQSGGVYTDTLGTTALTVTGSGTPSSPYLFSYTAPSGGTASYSMKFTAYTVKTNFGCSGVTEYGATSQNLVSEIDLPDGTKYTMTYEATPGFSGDVTGRLASITLPTGGTVSYSYSGGSNGVNCTDGSAATLSRTTPDGTWTYAHSEVSGAHWQTKVTTPADSQNSGSIGDDTVIDFQADSNGTSGTSNTFETQRAAYQGSSSSGTLLRTTTICYNTNTTNCSTTAVNSPITQRNVSTTLPGSANLQSQSIYKYNTSGMLTEQDDYDWGSGAVGSLLKKTVITPNTSLGNNITAFRQSVVVTNGSGTTVSQTNYNYDETSVTTTSGTPQHISISGSRGNLTSINYYTAGSTYLTKRMSYFDTGNVQTATDLNSAQTTYTYGACGNSFPTSISEPLSLSKSVTWNCTGGVQLTVTDENSQTTTKAYTDPYFWRPASVTDPTNAVASVTYTGQTQAENSMSFNSGNSVVDSFSTADNLGRGHVAQVRETPGGSNFDSLETDYDTFGRASRVTLPYVGTAGQTNSSAPAKITTYDALDRVLQISDASGGYRSYTYPQNDVYITRGPAPSGENTKRRQEEFDALGRLTSVCEITSATGSGICAQNSSQTGYWTKYTYDALGRLTGVTQNAQGTGQTRTYVYDLLGRLTSETNPENSTTTYVYDTDTTCGTSSGDLVKKTDAVGNVTCDAYDSLHRPTAITYPSGSYASVTPAKHFVYDAATVNSLSMSNVKARMAEAYTCTGSCTSKITDEGFSYTTRGETSDVYESTPNSGGYYHINETFWANSAPNQLTAPGLPTITLTPDGEGRPYKISASSGQNPVTNIVFNAASLPTSVTYGSSDSDAFSYDSNTNRVTQYQFTVNGQSLTGALTWNADHTLASQNITDPFNSSDAQNCSYTHDDLTRLASVNCGSIFSQTFSFDALGNISKSGTYTFQPTYNGSTNQFSSIPGCSSLSYDSNGNVLNDCNHSYSMDSAGHAITVDSVNLTFDALGRMVEQNRSGAYTQIVYSPRGAKLALMSGQTLQKGLVPLPGGGVAVYNSSGLLYYGHSDHLGSIKLGSTTSRTVSFDLAYGPFGETYATSGSTDPAFTGQRQDTVSGLYDFPARQYSTQGRWPNPDPSGLASVNLSDPQTLNRYAYVRNNPLAMVDPNGLCPQENDPGSSIDWPCPDPDSDAPSGAAGGGEGGGGGSDSGSSAGDDGSGNGLSDPNQGDPNNSGSSCPPDDPSCNGVIDDSGNPPMGSSSSSYEGIVDLPDLPLVDNTDLTTLYDVFTSLNGVSSFAVETNLFVSFDPLDNLPVSTADYMDAMALGASMAEPGVNAALAVAAAESGVLLIDAGIGVTAVGAGCIAANAGYGAATSYAGSTALNAGTNAVKGGPVQGGNPAGAAIGAVFGGFKGGLTCP